MKSLLAFIKKETMEQFRSGRLMILGILFVLLGVMNGAITAISFYSSALLFIAF